MHYDPIFMLLTKLFLESAIAILGNVRLITGKGAAPCKAPWRAAVAPACRPTHAHTHTHTLTCTDILMTTSTSVALQLPSSASLFGRGCRATGCVNTAPDMSKERATRRSGTRLQSSVDSTDKHALIMQKIKKHTADTCTRTC